MKRFKPVFGSLKVSEDRTGAEEIVKRFGNDAIKVGRTCVHYKSDDQRFLEARRNIAVDKLVMKVQTKRRTIVARKLLRDLKHFNPRFEEALK